MTVPAPPVRAGAVAVIIDDLGHSREAAAPFLETRHPVALSILPGRPFAGVIAESAARAGKTVLLHLPMEPSGYPASDPGPGAILLSQGNGDIRRRVLDDLATVPFAAGVNNHMGSKATADRRVMEQVLYVIRERGLFFVDSRTTPDTVGLEVARRLGVPSTERSVFLDNIPEREAVLAKVDELLDIARRQGWAVGIGHPNGATAEVLDDLAERARRRGIQWVTIASLVSHADPGNRDIVR